MKAIICLGNPGNEYQNTRHNIGFKMADFIIKNETDSQEKKEFNALTTKIKINNKTCLIVKPQTFMNLSGESAIKIINFYKLSLKNILIIYDDCEIDFGYIRFKKKGRSGTHNGMKSIIESLNSNEISRLRIGVGPVPEKWDIKDFVLANFSSTESNNLKNIFVESKKAITYWIMNETEKSMSLINKKNILNVK